MKKALTVNNNLLHVKTADNEERIILPITSIANVMNAPRISSLQEMKVSGQPYTFSTSAVKTYSEEELKKLGAPLIPRVDIRNFILNG